MGRWNLRPDTCLRDLRLGHPQQALAFLTIDNAPFIGACLAGDDIHESCLASAIWADHSAQFAVADLEGQIVYGLEPVE